MAVLIASRIAVVVVVVIVVVVDVMRHCTNSGECARRAIDYDYDNYNDNEEPAAGKQMCLWNMAFNGWYEIEIEIGIGIGIVVEGLADQSDFDSDPDFDKHGSSV